MDSWCQFIYRAFLHTSFVTFVAIYSDLEVHVWTSPACFSDENMWIFPFTRGWWCLVCSTECCWMLRRIKLQHFNIHQVTGKPARVWVGFCLSHMLNTQKVETSYKASETLVLKLLHSGSVKNGLLFHHSTQLYLSVFLYGCFHCCSCGQVFDHSNTHNSGLF